MIYQIFTHLETRKLKRKTIPIEEAGDLKVPCFITKQKISPTSSRSEGGGYLRFSRGSSPD